MELNLINKTVLITGTNNPLGIGAKTAIHFCMEGCNVVMAYKRIMKPYNADNVTVSGMDKYNKNNTSSMDCVENLIRQTGARYLILEKDIEQESDIHDIYNEAEKSFGGVDILVNNAAACHDNDTIFTLTKHIYDDTYGVNVKGTIFMIREYVVRYISRNGHMGSIVNLSTDAAQVFAGQIAYGSSKAALEALTRALAIELGPLGIRVNAIAPGPTQTGYISEKMEKAILNDIPLRRLGSPTDIAEAILFLCSERAAWLTGQVIKVSGGHSI